MERKYFVLKINAKYILMDFKAFFLSSGADTSLTKSFRI